MAVDSPDDLPVAHARGVVRGYFVPVLDTREESPVTLGELASAVLRRWWLIALVTLACVAGGAVLAFVPKKQYQAAVVMSAVSEAPGGGAGLGGLIGQFGGLASLAGISLSGSGLDKEAIATLRSRTFTMRFIEERNLLPVLFASRWDPERQSWKPRWFGDDPNLADAFQKFDRKIRDVSQDRRSGLVSLTIRWSDPALAAEWANELVERVNVEMRTRAVAESRRNIEYLEKQAAVAQVAAVRDSISRVIENEVRRSMLAAVRNDYAFRVIDPAVALDEDEFVSPNRKLLLAASFGAGVALGLLLALVLHFRTRAARRAA
jgi:capsular polysaccharide biosynthesis protein